MFALTKFIGWLVSPLPLVVLGGLLALVLVWRGWRRTGAGLAALCFAALWLASTPWVAGTLAAGLEQQYPVLAVGATPLADAAVVLGGAVSAAQPPHKPQFHLSGAADRVWHAGLLYRAGKVRRLVLSGGNQPGFEWMHPEAEAMREMLRVMGVPDSAMTLDTHSSNTRENAGYSVKLVQEIGAHRVLLVTSAMHMPRAMAIFQVAFRGTGVTLIPASTDAGTSSVVVPASVWQWLPDVGSLAWSSRAIKEYLGLLQVWLLSRGFP